MCLMNVREGRHDRYRARRYPVVLSRGILSRRWLDNIRGEGEGRGRKGGKGKRNEVGGGTLSIHRDTFTSHLGRATALLIGAITRDA